MYKYTYKTNLDPTNKLNSVIGVTPNLISSAGSVSICFVSELSAYAKINLDQYMTDAGYSYVGMAQGGVETSSLAVSPNGTVWKISISDLGVLSTQSL